MAQKNKYLDEPVWVCERRFTWDTPSQCLKTWRIYPNLLEAVRQEGYQRHLALRDVFRTEIDYWLGGYEKIEPSIVQQYQAWVNRLWNEERARRRARYSLCMGSKPRAWRIFRHPRTRQACRQATQPAEDEGYAVPKCRAKRNQHHLPNTWDDICRKDREDRSWKHNRKTQYRKPQPSFRKKQWEEITL